MSVYKKKVWVLMDFAEYDINNVLIFSTLAGLKRYALREYGTLGIDLKYQNNLFWDDGFVYESKEARQNGDEPLAVYKEKTIR